MSRESEYQSLLGRARSTEIVPWFSTYHVNIWFWTRYFALKSWVLSSSSHWLQRYRKSRKEPLRIKAALWIWAILVNLYFLAAPMISFATKFIRRPFANKLWNGTRSTAVFVN